MTVAANLADEMLRRLKLGLVDADDIPPAWDDIVLYYSIGLEERDIDRIKNPNQTNYENGNGGEMASKEERAAFFAQKKREQEERQREAARQRARDDLTGRSK